MPRSWWLAGLLAAALPGAAPRADDLVDGAALRTRGTTIQLATPGEGTPRVVEADLGELGGGRVRVVYDLDTLTAELTTRDLAEAPAWSVGARMLLGEMGSYRLTDAQLALAEAVAIVHTVHNRMDEAVWNPDGLRRIRGWPGCGAAGTFQTCADPMQYTGLRQTRALRPLRAGIPEERLLAAFDTAVLAWWLVDSGLVPDTTHGAIGFVHRCGGAAYGRPTTRCDGRPDVPDVAGAHPRTGPLLLRGPGRFDPERRNYGLVEKARVDYRQGLPRAPGAWLLPR